LRKTRFTGSARRTSAASISGSKTTQHSDPEQGDSLLRFLNGPAPFIDNFGRFLYIVAEGGARGTGGLVRGRRTGGNMEKLLLPSELPEGFLYTDENGLKESQVQERRERSCEEKN